jgi:hypothetical protein
MPFLQRCRLGVLQFVPMQILCTTLCYVLTYKKMYQEGVWINPKEEDLPSHGFLVFGLGYGRFTPFGYVNLLRILSCTIALYCLVYFYRGTRKLLADIDPFVKFLSIKMVVFATFYQRIVLTIGTNKLPQPINFKRWWMKIMLMHFNSYEYFGELAKHYEDGQTHHGCDCVGSQDDTGFEYFDISWGAKTPDGAQDFSYCCNGILDSTDLASGGFLDDFKDDPHATKRELPDFTRTKKKDLVCNFGMGSQSRKQSGAYNSLWCPINTSTCKRPNEAPWIKEHFLTKEQRRYLKIGVGHESWWNGTEFSPEAGPAVGWVESFSHLCTILCTPFAIIHRTCTGLCEPQRCM